MRALIEHYEVAPMPDASARGLDVTASWITPEHLSAAHLDALVRALSNVLATDVAEFTYAEIIDGLPTAESFTEFRSFYPAEGEHPACHHHRLCEGALEAAREARARFDPLTLRFDPQVLQAFQDQHEGSRSFSLRLVELVAVSLHQIAVRLYETTESPHRAEYQSWWESWRERHKDAIGIGQVYAISFPPVPFFHCSYHRPFDQFPRGKADIVGYWAEAKILGGVALFNRGPSELECNDLLIHGNLRMGPHTIYPPTAEQWDALVAFLSWDATAAPMHNDDAPPPCPLPLHATRDNLPRYTPYFAMKYQHIFRDRFAFRLPARYEPPAGRCVQGPTDVSYPECEDWVWIILSMGQQAGGEAIDEEEMERRKNVLRACQPGNPYSYAPWPEEILEGEGMNRDGSGAVNQSYTW